MSSDILYSESNLICILTLLLLCIKLKKSVFLQTQRKVLFLVIIANMGLFSLDAFWIFLNNSNIDFPLAANWTLNVFYYILGGILGYLWFNYSETVQESKFVVERKYRFFAAIPMLILIVLSLCSVKTGWLFYIDANNDYHRGPAFAVQLLLSYGYVITTAVKAFFLSLHTEDYAKKTDFRILSFFVIPTLLSGGLQVVFSGYPILCIGNTCGILYVFITLQEQLISIDALTKLNNRNQLLQYLSYKYSHPNESKRMYLLLIDVDFFKSINDRYGHLEGDHALRSLAECLKKVANGKKYFLARYGGDEFILVCEMDTEEDIQMVCSSIHERLKKVDVPYTLSVSIGYAQYTSEMKTHQELIGEADAELYRVKKQRKDRHLAE